MYTLVFLICMPSGPCLQQAPDVVFRSLDQCEGAAAQIIARVEGRVREGSMANHTALFQCIAWGQAS